MRLPFSQFAQSTPLFTLDEARRLYKKDERNRSLLNLLHRLKKQGRVRQLANGAYAGAFSAVPLNRYRVPAALRDDAVPLGLDQAGGSKRGVDSLKIPAETVNHFVLIDE